MTDKPAVSAELSRDLSLFHIVMMGMGMMIGAGVFLGIGVSIGEVGPGGLVLTFALNGVVALFTAMSYAELSSAIPRAGGAYNFARIGFGRGTSFLAGWMEWFASSVAGAMYAVTFALYTLRYLRGLGLLEWLPGGSVLPMKVVAVLVAGFFIYINYRGASETGKVGAFFTLGQTLFMVAIGVLGVVVALREPERLRNFEPFMPNGWVKLLVTMGFTYVAFEGFEVIAQAGDEAIDPKRNIPKAMLYSVYFVTLIYVVVAFATVVAVRAVPAGVTSAPWAWVGSFREEGFAEAVGKLVPYSSLLLTLAVIFSSTSALNATIYSATRASYALGRDRMLPALFASISPTRKTPHMALAFTAVLVVVAATLLPTTDVASSASMMFIFLFFLVNVCVSKIRLNLGDELDYGFLMPLFPLFPLLAIAAQGLLAFELRQLSPMAWLVAPAWIVAGLVIYHAYSKSRAVATEDEIHVLEEEEAPAGDEYRVMVAVANPENALGMVLTTYKLCGAKDARVELLHMVPVPDTVPLSDAETYMQEGREAIVEAMLYLAPQFPLSSTIRYCRNAARGIVSAVREKRTDLLIMGWHGEGGGMLYRLGSTLDPVIERSPCNVVVLKGCRETSYRRVLVPLAGGPHSAFALEIASILADPEQGEVVAFTVAGHRRFDVAKLLADSVDSLHIPPERVQAKVVTARDVVQAILAEAEGYYLIVLGCTQDPLVYQFARDPIPETVARRTDKPVVMVKAGAGIRSWVKRWI